MPFIAAHRFDDLSMTTVVALHNPVLHQYRLAVRETDRVGLATDKTRQQATRASVAVFIRILAVHLVFGRSSLKRRGPAHGASRWSGLGIPGMKVLVVVIGTIGLIRIGLRFAPRHTGLYLDAGVKLHLCSYQATDAAGCVT